MKAATSSANLGIVIAAAQAIRGFREHGRPFVVDLDRPAHRDRVGRQSRIQSSRHSSTPFQQDELPPLANDPVADYPPQGTRTTCTGALTALGAWLADADTGSINPRVQTLTTSLRRTVLYVLGGAQELVVSACSGEGRRPRSCRFGRYDAGRRRAAVAADGDFGHVREMVAPAGVSTCSPQRVPTPVPSQ